MTTRPSAGGMLLALAAVAACSDGDCRTDAVTDSAGVRRDHLDVQYVVRLRLVGT